MIKRYLFTCFFFPLAGYAQQVTTIVNDPSTRFRDDLIFDSAGNLYCSDYGGSSVFKRTPDGTVTTFATGFNTPNGLAFDSQNNLFVADNAGNRIYKLSYSGQFLDTFDITGPSGLIKMPDNDTLLFTQYPGNSLSKLAPDGNVVPVYTGAPIDGAVGLVWSPDERLYLANFSNSQIFEVIFGGTVTLDSLATIPGPGAGNAWLGFIEYTHGFIWATAYNANKIYKINPVNGEVTWVAGSTSGSIDGNVSTALFSNPNGIAASPDGDTLYISDYGTGRLRMITDIPLTVEETTEELIELYPNPAKALFSLKLPKGFIPERVVLFDMSGRQLRIWDAPEPQMVFSTEGLTAGSYVLRIEQGKSGITKRLLIR